MKKILSFLVVMSLMFVMVGVVSAQSFVNPLSGNIKGIVNVEWENSAGDTSLQLQYAEGTCAVPTSDWNKLADSGLTSQESYSWNTNSVIEGEVCLRLQSDSITHDSLDLVVDNENPNVMMSDVSFPVPDEKNNLVKVSYVHSDNVGVTFCEIDFGGMKTKDCLAGSSRSYQFEDNGDYDISITVRDAAGNEATESFEVEVVNVAPELIDFTLGVQIDAPNNFDNDGDNLKEVAVGESVLFEAYADDVQADLDAGLTCTFTFDGLDDVVATADSVGYCFVSYVWNSASTHTVDLNVEDKDGDSINANQYEIEIDEPEEMSPMQQVVMDNSFEFELDAPWGVSNKKNFQTDLTTPITCEAVKVPGMNSGLADEMLVSQNGANTRCHVVWTPSNNQRGEHLVIIKAYNGANEYKYYSFDVTVYSWGIALGSGWNLISIPYVPADSSIEEVFADILPNVAYEGTSTATIFQYDSTYDDNEGRWYKARPNSGKTSFTWSSSTYELENVVPGYGYWIKMENSDTLFGVEENFQPSQGPVPSIELATDAWSLIGRFGTGNFGVAPVTLDEAFGTLNGNWYTDGFLKWDGVSSWSQATTIDLGEGYWLRTKTVTGEDTLTYEPLGYYFL